jgi:hypothetical protein
MKNLIIHPKDDTTDFLCGIYSNLSDKTLITGDISEKKLAAHILTHERVLMLGHGTPSGLISKYSIKNPYGYVINDSMAEYLRNKNNSVFIWCNADQFVRRYGLKGFYTGMFISEVLEADMFDLPGVTEEMIGESNNSFSGIVSKYLDETTDKLYHHVLADYGVLAGTNTVAAYNHQRLYFNS